MTVGICRVSKEVVKVGTVELLMRSTGTSNHDPYVEYVFLRKEGQGFT